ncbi:DUF2963 domain-containing protein [Paulownia witches'-broom phytoplasma]|uniref:DUF2963 domain-containing protein n=1 Tax=Paulownia witches'-broom phytoplasma TaxID=39647 RepID=UPI002D1F4F6C|nr:hypothetical protein PAWBP_7080 [Paulownia witches'-broom phytoplasma]
MSSFRIGNKHYKIIPFLITTGTLLFFVFWIGGIAYKYHLETEERRKLQEVDIAAKAKELNDVIHNENKKLKEENEHLKSAPYEFIRDNGEKEYYNLFTHKLVKKIDKNNTIWEYDKNNGFLLKKTDKDNNVEDYDSQGKLIKKILLNGVCMEYNPNNSKLIKRKNIDGSIEEFDDNEEKFKEIDKNGKVKIFKTKLYQNISDFKKLNFTIRQLKDIGFSLQELKDAGYTLHQFISVGYTEKELKDAGYTAKEINKITKPNQEIYYRKDGKTIKVIEKLNPEGKIIQRIYYNPDGTVKEVINPKS